MQQLNIIHRNNSLKTKKSVISSFQILKKKEFIKMEKVCSRRKKYH